MPLFRILFFSTAIALLFSSCDSGAKPTAQKPAPPFPSVEQALMTTMWETCTNVDFIFYEYSFSMNQTEPASIKNTLTYISTMVPEQLDPSCKPIGRIFFVSNGESLGEAEFFLGDTCNYFIFFKDGKKVAANNMTPKGEEFLKNTIQKVTAGMPK